MILLFIAVGAVMIWRSFFSFNQSDESFYLSTVHRLWLGDKLVTDEWHPTQFYSPILLPFYALYRFIVPSGNGVILFFRILTVCFTMVVGLYASIVFQRLYGMRAIFMAAAAMMIYCGRGNMMGPSYYTLSINFLLLALLFRADAVLLKKDPLFLLSGVFSALTVFCMPYMAIPFIIYSVAAFFVNSGSKEMEGHSFLEKQRFLILYLIGMVGMAALYLICFFRIFHIGEVLTNFVYIFRDPEHTGSFSQMLGTSIKSYRYFTGEIPFYLMPVASLIVLAYCLHGKGILKKIVLKVLLLFSMIGFTVLMMDKSINMNGRCAAALSTWCMPIVVIVLYRRYIKKERQADDGGLVFSMVLAGLTMAAAYGGASNTGLGGFTSGFVIVAVAVCICLSEYVAYYYDESTGSIFTKGIVEGCLVAMMIIMLMVRFFGVYRDADIINLDSKITDGPAAGLYTTRDVVINYEQALDTVRDIDKNVKGEYIFHTAVMPWAYLCTNKKCGAPTTWCTTLDSPILEDYYILHLDRIPDIVVVYKPEVGSYADCYYAVKGGEPFPNDNDLEGSLWDHIQRNSYKSYETAVATVYYR